MVIRLNKGKESLRWFSASALTVVVFLFSMMGCTVDPKDKAAQDEGCKGIIDLPKTGQTTSRGTRDDGELQMGVAWPVPRLTVNIDPVNGNTITDNLTGLMWDQIGNRFGTSTWEQALIDCNGLELGGHTDWRLPNCKELRSLVNYEVQHQANWLNGQGFTDVATRYWSSTTYATGTSGAWGVDMSYGDVYANSKTTIYYVIAVRSGQTGGAVSLPETGQTTCYDSFGNVISCIDTGQDGDLSMGLTWPIPRFTDNGDGTICDKLTGLMWEQSPSDTTRTWIAALTYAYDLSLGGHSDDWRLPNVNELESLINAGQAHPEAWLNQQGFSNVQAASYWSSTSYPPHSSLAWDVNMLDGSVNFTTKTLNYDVLAVRSGQ